METATQIAIEAIADNENVTYKWGHNRVLTLQGIDERMVIADEEEGGWSYTCYWGPEANDEYTAGGNDDLSDVAETVVEWMEQL